VERGRTIAALTKPVKTAKIVYLTGQAGRLLAGGIRAARDLKFLYDCYCHKAEPDFDYFR
jgi:hypothetical protein